MHTVKRIKQGVIITVLLLFAVLLATVGLPATTAQANGCSVTYEITANYPNPDQSSFGGTFAITNNTGSELSNPTIVITWNGDEEITPHQAESTTNVDGVTTWVLPAYLFNGPTGEPGGMANGFTFDTGLNGYYNNRLAAPYSVELNGNNCDITYIDDTGVTGGSLGGEYSPEDIGNGGNIGERPAVGGEECRVALRYDNAWDGGVVANFAIFNNTGTDFSDGWDLEFAWPGFVGVEDGNQWSVEDVTITNNGNSVSLGNPANAADFAGTINHNDVRIFGFVAEVQGNGVQLPKPTEYTLVDRGSGDRIDCSPPQGQGLLSSNYGGTLPILADQSNDYGRDPQNQCQDNFFLLYDQIHDPDNGYFDEEGIPYHTVEELNVEAPDFGHVTTSEAVSYLMLLEAAYGKLTGDYTNLEKAWAIMEHTIIPDAVKQPTVANHNSDGKTATYAPEFPEGPENYPSALMANGGGEGSDPIVDEVVAKHGNAMYLMHWLLDVDNQYSFGGNANHNSVYINTFQRGAQESTWETVPHPSIDEFAFGGENGFLDIFIGDGTYTKQWRFTNAPDAEARAIEGVRYAQLWAEQQGHDMGIIDSLIPKAAKMGEFLRYDMFDKYMMPIGCKDATGPGNCTTADGNGLYDSSHDLLAWYTSWGGPLPLDQDWNFRIGSSDAHFGYQDPWAAYVLVEDEKYSQHMTPQGVAQWENSLERQVQLYMWLQSAEGGIGGGVTNSWDGRYENASYANAETGGTAYFYGMAYDDNPVYHDPGSNTWYGFQAWSMQRVMEYALDSGRNDQEFLTFVDKWSKWTADNILFYEESAGPGKYPFTIPSGIAWEGEPSGGDYRGGPIPENKDLHVTVTGPAQDVGVAASVVRTLLAYSEIEGVAHKEYVQGQALKLMNTLGSLYHTDEYGTEGVALTEFRGDYTARFMNETYIPSGQTYTLGDGSTVDSSNATFSSIHWFYEKSCELDQSLLQNKRLCDEYTEVLNAIADDRPVEIKYHRFWAQVDNSLQFVTADEYGLDCQPLGTAGTISTPVPETPTPDPSTEDGVTVNCDNIWNLIDVILIKRFDAFITPSTNDCAEAENNEKLYLPECDLNGDNKCGLIDAVIIQQCNAFVPNDYCAAIDAVNSAQ